MVVLIVSHLEFKFSDIDSRDPLPWWDTHLPNMSGFSQSVTEYLESLQSRTEDASNTPPPIPYESSFTNETFMEN